MDLSKVVENLKTETLAHIVSELSDADGYSPNWDSTCLVDFAKAVGKSRIGDEFDQMVARYRGRYENS